VQQSLLSQEVTDENHTVYVNISSFHIRST
jgi:hypothetical protein